MKYSTQFLVTFFLLFTLPIQSKAQIKIYSNNTVRIGDPSSPAPTHTHLEVDQETRFKCFTSNNSGGTGLILGNYNNSYPSGGPYDDPIIKPWFSNSLWIGRDSFKIWQIYSYEQWVDHAEVVGSDERFKVNVKPLSYGLNAVLALKPKIYDFVSDTSNTPTMERKEAILERGKGQIGLIAQDVKKLIPEVVEYNSEGDYYGISYSLIVPVLIKAIQEQQAKIELLESRIRSIEVKE